MSDRPNIIICTSDQLRAFALGCYGNGFVRTPSVDRLAAEGMRFETGITNAPVCMAARSVILSGQHNRTCTGGVTNVHHKYVGGGGAIPEYPDHGRPHLKDQTLPEVLQNSGYHTEAIGKWHIHSWPHDIGFDHYVIPRVHHCHTGQSFTENGGSEFTPSGYSVDYEAGRVEDFLHDRSHTDQPFFLYYNISPPHCPLADAPEKYLTMYDPDAVPIRPNVDLDTPLNYQDGAFKTYRYDFRHYQFNLPYAAKLPKNYTLRHVIAEYYGLVTWMDAAVGRMLAALDASGLARDTIVLFTSDHGDNLGSHGLVQKETPNEEAIRVPFIVRWPAMARQPKVCDRQVVSLVDIMPTLLDLANITIPNHAQGTNFAPVVRGEQDVLDSNHAIIEFTNEIAVRTATHTGVMRRKNGKLAESLYSLHDNEADPYQFRNLMEHGEQADLAGQLVDLLRSWDTRTPWMQ